MKVEQFYNKNQFRIYGDGKNIFQSYNSTIAIIENNQLTLGRDWDYSRTTLKHLYYFLNDYMYGLNWELRETIQEALRSNNTKKAIQKLIDNNIIKYNGNL